MDRNFYDLMLKLIDETHMKKIVRLVNSRVQIRGFRPGKLPKSKIITDSYTVDTVREQMLTAIYATYFPNIKKEGEDTALIVNDKTLPGNMAYYIIEQKEAEFPMSMEELQNIYEQRTRNEASHPTEHSIERERMDNQVSDGETQDRSVGQENIDVTHDEKLNEQTSETISTANGESNTLIQCNVDDRRYNAVKYLGYMYLVSGPYSKNYYNFHPTAVIMPNGEISELNMDKRNDLFPSYGNINIYSPSRDEDELASNFAHGQIYILDIDDSWRETNYRGDGELNRTNHKISIATLEEHGAIQHPNDCGLISVINYNDLHEAIVSGRPIQLPDDLGLVEGDNRVLLKDQNKLVGPYAAFCDNGRWYVNPQLQKNDYVIMEYDNNPSAYITISFSERGYSGSSIIKRYAMIDKLAGKYTDYISDAELLSELNRALEGMNADDSSIISSAFTDSRLPDDIVRARRDSLEKIFRQYTDLKASIGTIQTSVNALLVNASKQQKETFDDTFATLAKDPSFMLRIQKYRIIAEEIEKKEAELKKQKEELERTLQKANEAKETRVEEQEALLTEQIQKQKDELDRIGGELSTNLEKLHLTNDINKLKLEVEVQKRISEEHKQDQKNIEEVKNKLLAAFEAEAKKPLEAIAQYELQEEVAAIVNRATGKHNNQIAAKRLETLRTRCDAYAAIQQPAKEELVQIICDRVKLYRDYSKNDIINIMICLTQGFLTVFSGEPGTGKTSICDIIAHALGLDNQQPFGDGTPRETRYTFVPVERGWSSKRDFIGYYNPLTKRFDKANSAVYTALETTSAEMDATNKDGIPPYFILLDEANLSPMEYYWADFMRACDMPSIQTEIQLSEYTRFRVGDSLRFMATINNDQTTENLSPRLIDRAWIISLPQPKAPKEVDFSNDYHEPISLQLMKAVFESGKEAEALNSTAATILSDVLGFFKTKLNVAISPRSLLALEKYCLTGSRLFEDSNSIPAEVIAVDFAIAQKLLPKIQLNGSYREKLNELHSLLLSHSMLKSASILTAIIQNGEANMHYYQYFG